MFKSWLILSCAIVLGGCAVTPPPTAREGQALFHDTAFAAPAQRVDAAEVMRPSPRMLQFVAQARKTPLRVADPRRHLVDLLYRGQDSIGIDYDASVTRTAAETFDARSGNCLSLMIMTASLARELALPLQFRSVEVDEAWSRSGDLLFASGHVNLALERPPGNLRFSNETDFGLVIDFQPLSEMQRQRVRPIGEATVLAMFMNNRAAEALARGAITDAYWYAREAMLQDPRFLIAYNTLGVIYLREGHPAWAQEVFQAVLDREPANIKVMRNLVGALQALGRFDDATRLSATVARLEPFPPYHFFNAGIEAMRAQDWAGAHELFSREVARQAYNPEFHFWLAQADFRLGRVREARRQMELALQNSTTAQDHAIYAAKLDWLRGQNTTR